MSCSRQSRQRIATQTEMPEIGKYAATKSDTVLTAVEMKNRREKKQAHK